MTNDYEIPDDVEAALLRQDEAFALLERLRADEPYRKPRTDTQEGRRNFRRWPLPVGVAVEWHDGERWHVVDVIDLGIGGARARNFPSTRLGPAPIRLRTPSTPTTLALADIMWREGDLTAGIRFEFTDPEERSVWADGLIDALLAKYEVKG